MAQRQQITLVLFTILYTACTHYCRTLFHHDTVGENVDYVKWRQEEEARTDTWYSTAPLHWTNEWNWKPEAEFIHWSESATLQKRLEHSIVINAAVSTQTVAKMHYKYNPRYTTYPTPC